MTPNGYRSLVATGLAVVALVFPGLSSAQEPAPDGTIPGQWIVTLDRTANPNAEAFRLTQTHGGQVRHVYSAALNGFSFQGPDAAAAAIGRSPLVLSVVPNRAVQAIAQTLPAGVQRIDAGPSSDSLTAHGMNYRGLGTRIAILDTGISTHDDLNNAYSGLGLNCMMTPPSTVPADWEDGHGHGTHVSGTATALDNDTGVIGVAPLAELVPVKVLDDTGSGTWETVICGIDYVTTQVTDFGVTITAANLSLAGPGSSTGFCADLLSDPNALDNDPLHKSLCAAVNAHVTIIVGAGNSDIDASNEVPAAYGGDPGIVTVSALADYDGEPGGNGGCLLFFGLGRQCDDTFAKFSNWGSKIDIVAPGVQVYSTDLNNSYGNRSGTSMAAPHVAGVAALVKGVNSGLTPAQVETLLKEHGECPDGSQNAGSGNCSGQGQWTNDPDGIAEPLVNAFWAAEAAAGGGDVNTPPTASFTWNCTDLACDFDGNGSTDSDGTIEAYDWDFGDGNTGTGVTVSHTYAAGGDYTVTLTVTDDDSATDTVSNTVTVTDPNANTPPTASFTWSCTDLACDFDGSGSMDSDGTIAAYDWDFGDGNTGTGVIASHTYAAGGTYTVTLTVTDDDGATDMATDSVTVAAPGDMTLSATGYKVRGLQKADLTWNNATSTNVDVYRDGTLITTTANDGSHTDNIDNRGGGSYTYEVCEAGTATCSNSATVSF